MAEEERLIHVLQGEHRVSAEPGLILSTVLGSCVSVCLRDPARAIGGLNHFLLPGADPSTGRDVKYGAHAMELLVNAMLRAGAERGRLEGQIYGGANVYAKLGRIGEANALFARAYLRTEGFRLLAEDTGGRVGRRLRFDPRTGIARVQYLDAAQPELSPGRARRAVIPTAAAGVELF